MKTTIYLRVAKTKKGAKCSASSKPNNEPLQLTKGWNNSSKEFVPTVAFAVTVDIPDSLFNKASQVIASLSVTEKNSIVAAQIEAPAAK